MRYFLNNAISSFVNFNANKRIVFEKKGNYKRALIRYYMLWLCQTALSTVISYVFISIVSHIFGNSTPLVSTLVRIPGDVILFFLSYNIQREWVFKDWFVSCVVYLIPCKNILKPGAPRFFYSLWSVLFINWCLFIFSCVLS